MFVVELGLENGQSASETLSSIMNKAMKFKVCYFFLKFQKKIFINLFCLFT